MVGIAQLVEQQVVGLEAEGSTPSIYPMIREFVVVPEKSHLTNQVSVNANTIRLLSNV